MSRRRLALAALLLLALLALPLASWRTQQRNRLSELTQQRLENALAASESRLVDAVEQLERRLEGLRRSESRRPFFHYRSLIHDPRGAAEGVAITPSPLLEGPGDPLIEAHLWIDAEGRISLPAVVDRFPELAPLVGDSEVCAISEELEAGFVILGDTSGDGPERLVELSAEDWRQLVEAERIYAELTGNASTPRSEQRALSGRVVVEVGPMVWHTLIRPSGATLAGLRRVVGPTGSELQGFSLDTEALAELLDSRHQLRPLEAVADDEIAVTINGTQWMLTAPRPGAEAIVAELELEGRSLRLRFWSVAVAALFLAMLVLTLLARAEAEAQRRAEFAAAAAHELRTPLAGLRLHAERLGGELDAPRRQRAAGRLIGEVDRLARLVANLLETTKLERGSLTLELRSADLAAELRRIAEAAASRLALEGYRIELELPQALLANFDPEALDSIVSNLLDNAEKYGRGKDERLATLRLEREDDRARIELIDSGPGIAPAARREIFRAFRRPEGQKAGGLGLGLALSAQLAKAMRGRLELVDAEHGHFRLILPLADRSPG